jgi:hypothetical protein
MSKLPAAAIFCLTLTACGGWRPNIGPSTIIDCAQQEQGQLASLGARLLPLISGGSPDWASVSTQAERAGVAIGGCVLADLVNQWLSRPRAIDQSHVAWDTLEHFRAAHGGVTFIVNGRAL